PVRCRHHNDSFIHSKAVHLHEKLVKRLLPLVMTAAETASPPSRHRVNLINEHNTRCVFLRILKQIAHTGRSHSHKHLYEVRSGDTEKRNARFTCHCLCKQSLTCSRRSLQEDALWY